MWVQRRYAVLIGVNAYEDPSAFPGLKYCVDDCKLLQQALTRADGFQRENVLLMVDGCERPEHLPRRNNIIEQLVSWSQRAGAADLFLVFFCGHAQEIGGSVYLMPADARRADTKMTGLQVEFLKSTLQTCRASDKLIVLDACHSGSGRDLGLMTPTFAEQLHAEGITILSACKVSEVAHECDDLRHGVFSYFLAQGLTGAAADPSGFVTGDRLYRHVYEEVVAWAGGHRLQQTPWRFSEGVGDPILIGKPDIRRRSVEGEHLSVPRFHYGSVVPPDYYIDREKELGEAQANIEAGQSFLLVGDRRAGKTSFCKKLIYTLMSTRGNGVLASYLNLQQCHHLKIETFLYETIINMVGEIARQVFHCKYTDLLRRDLQEASRSVEIDDVSLFGGFVNIFRQARKYARSRSDSAENSLKPQEFVRFVEDLLAIIRCKEWHSFVIFYDEANRLPGSFPVEMLMTNVEALSDSGVVSVYAASPEMAESFTALHKYFDEQVQIGPFANPEDIEKLLARYYFGDVSRTANLPLTRAAMDLLWNLSGGKPYLVQLLAGHSFRFALTQAAEQVTDAHVKEAREIIRVRRPEVIFPDPFL